MKAILLIITLSNQGYWFGEQEQSVSLSWSVTQNMPAADLQWELMLSDVRLAGDQIKMNAGEAPTVVKMKIPAVRVRTQMRWVYRLTARDGGKELDSGQRTINAFPPVPLSDMATRLADKKLFVVDQPQGLPALLAGAKIQATTVADTSKLELFPADIIVVAANQLDDSPFVQAPLLAQARAGAQVLLLQQRQPKTLMGYELRRRPITADLTWSADHPLFADLDAADRKSWLTGQSADLCAIRLPVDEPALEVVHWPREIAGTQPAPIDALVVVKAVAKGRFILCQLPLGGFQDDPRSQLLLQNALNYMLTRPEPTPPPSARPTTAPAPFKTVPKINIIP